MALTISLTGDWLSSFGNRKAAEGTITFDSSYPTGGEALAATDVGLSELSMLVLDQGESGYTFEWDRTDLLNSLLKVRGSGSPNVPQLVVEEVQTVAANVATLDNLPAYIVAVDVTAGSATPKCHVIPVGETPAAGEVAVDFTTGGMTFNATDAPTSVRVTYFPQKEGTIFDRNNMVIDEEITADAAGVNLASRAFAVQYVYNTTGGNNMVYEPVGEAPTASTNAVVDINNSSNTTVDTHADDDGDTLKVTYLLFSALPAASQQIDDADITLSSEAWNFATDGGIAGSLVVPAMGTHLVGEETADNQDVPWVGPSGTAAENIAEWDPYDNAILTNQTGTMTTTAIAWFKIPFVPLDSVGGPEEVGASTDLSAVTVRFMAIGK